MLVVSYFLQTVLCTNFCFIAGMLLITYGYTYDNMYHSWLPTTQLFNLHLTRGFLLVFVAIMGAGILQFQSRYGRTCNALYHIMFLVHAAGLAIEYYLSPYLVTQSFTGVELTVFIILQIVTFGFLVAYVYEIIMYRKMYSHSSVQPYTVVAGDPPEECSICFEEGDNKRVRLSCEHVYHKECIDKWFANRMENRLQKSCPNCREIV